MIERLKGSISILVTVCLLLMGIGTPAYAATYSDETSVTNHGRIGAVDISLLEEFPEDTTIILPNQTVDIATSIENEAKPAWIRMKVEYVTSEALTGLASLGFTELSDDLIQFANEDWVKIGEYYYLTTPMQTGDVKPFTESVTFPSDWDNSVVNSNIGMYFTAEAIQEAHFEPDFESDDPWHGAVIEAFDATEYQLKTVGNEQFSIVYENGSEGLVTVGDDFFSNWGDIMPGDTLTGTANIANHMTIPVKLYFKMESTGDEAVLEKLTMTIRNGEDIVFSGPLSENLDTVLLQQYEPNDTTEFSYELSVPAELNNAYALSDFETVWTFSAEEIPPQEEEPTPTQKMIQKIAEQIDTGDIPMYAVCGIAGLAVIVLIGIGVKRKKGGRV